MRSVVREWWRKLIGRKAPSPFAMDGRSRTHVEGRDQTLADVADLMKSIALRIPNASPEALVYFGRSLYCCGNEIESLQVVRRKPTGSYEQDAIDAAPRAEPGPVNVYH